MGGIITDSHLVARDRMGRLVTFLGRLVQDGWVGQARGIGIDTATAVLVEPTTGLATVVGSGTSDSAAFFVAPTAGSVLVCKPKSPQTYTDLSVVRLTPGETFDLSTWTGGAGLHDSISARDGVLTPLGAGTISG